MPSVLGLLEAREKKVREKKVREEVARLRAALGEAEAALQRLVDARVTVAEVLAEPSCVVAEPRSAVAGSVVPHRAEGMEASVLAPDYERIVSVLESEAGREGVRCQQLAVALGLGGPGEGRGAAVEGETSGGAGVGPAGAARGVHRARGAGLLKAPGRRPARRLLMSMVIDHRACSRSCEPRAARRERGRRRRRRP